MKLTQLALEYAASAARLDRRIAVLRAVRKQLPPGSERCKLERRLRSLQDMRRETLSLARYLEHYYDRSDAR